MLVGDLVGELAVIDLVVIPADTLLGHSGGAAGLEDIERLALERCRNPHFGLKVAQPLVLKMRELCHVREGLNFLPRIKVLLRPIEPERTAGLRRKMPRNDLLQMGFEFGLRGGDDFGGYFGHGKKIVCVRNNFGTSQGQGNVRPARHFPSPACRFRCKRVECVQ